MNEITMCYITLLLVLINVISFFVRKIFRLKVDGSLFCGIFGAVAKKSKKINLHKVKILGLYNQTRGKDSCGYFYNGTLKKNANAESLWSNFIEKNIIDEPNVTNNVFIGHCRQKSTGKVDKESAHPFEIDEKLIIAHNGTLQNHFELCNKYNIDHKDISVDSEALGKLIVERGFDILNEYRGYAALLMHKLDDPNTLYVYHGESKEWVNAKEMQEERPLFLMETPEAIYFSSMDSALLAIRTDEKQHPARLKCNKVYRIHEGVFDYDNSFEVSREFNNSGYYDPKKNSKNEEYLEYEAEWRRQYSADAVSCIRNQHCKVKESGNFQESREESWKGEKGNELLIKESFPKKCFDPELFDSGSSYVWYWQNRYRIEKNVFCEGELFLDKKGVIHEKKEDRDLICYFFKGVRLKDKEAFEEVNKLLLTEESFIHKSVVENFAKGISKYSCYPVCNIENEGEDIPETEKGLMWIDGRRVGTTAYTAQYGKRSYEIKDGKLIGINPVEKNDIVLGKDTEDGTGISYFSNQPVVEEEERVKAVSKISKDLRIVKGSLGNIYNMFNPNLVDNYSRFFTKKFKDPDEFYDSPSEVHIALEFYMADVLKIPIYESATKEERQEIQYKCNTFVNSVINDASTIAEYMDEDFSDYRKYLDLAIIWNDNYKIIKSADKEMEMDLNQTLIKNTEKNESY